MRRASNGTSSCLSGFFFFNSSKDLELLATEGCTCKRVTLISVGSD